jgi:hypothetical protein
MSVGKEKNKRTDTKALLRADSIWRRYGINPWMHAAPLQPVVLQIQAAGTSYPQRHSGGFESAMPTGLN